MNDQKTAEWHKDRCGKVTASRLNDCMLVTPEKYKVLRASGTTLRVFDKEHDALVLLDEANQKKDGHSLSICPAKPLLGFENYAAELVCERLTGEVRMIGEPPAIRWGNDNEPFALRAYENRTGEIINRTGFILSGPETGLNNYGASPDGEVGDNGLVEAKCPLLSTNHIRCFHSGIPEEHFPQMEGQLLATGREWVDFVSYDPRFKGDYQHLQLFVARYISIPGMRDNIVAGIIRMEAAVKLFISTLPKAA